MKNIRAISIGRLYRVVSMQIYALMTFIFAFTGCSAQGIPPGGNGFWGNIKSATTIKPEKRYDGIIWDITLTRFNQEGKMIEYSFVTKDGYVYMQTLFNYSDGQVQEKLIYMQDVSNEQDSLALKYRGGIRYEYDNCGRIKSATDFDEDNTIKEKSIYEYPDSITTVITRWRQGHYEGMDMYIDTVITEINDTKRRLIESSASSHGKIVSAKYNLYRSDRLMETIEYILGSYTAKNYEYIITRYQYNKNGLVKGEKIVTIWGGNIEEVKDKYNNGIWSKNGEMNLIYKYSYDDHGNWISLIKRNKNGIFETSTREIEYF